MSNIAGKAYAMNVVTPLRWYLAWYNRLIFNLVVKFPSFLQGLVTLSLIHYARWTIVDRDKFPHLDESQPKEALNYSYMLFCSNFNGSWDQYVDSFTFSIPSGLDLFWSWNVHYSKSVPLTPFHDYIRYNQVDTTHYYTAYPMAASNDVKSAHRLKNRLIAFSEQTHIDSDAFLTDYNQLLRDLQTDLGSMSHTPIVSLADQAVLERRRRDVHSAN